MTPRRNVVYYTDVISSTSSSLSSVVPVPSLVFGAYPNGPTGLYFDTHASCVVVEAVLVVNDKQLLLISTTTSITASHQGLSTDDTHVNYCPYQWHLDLGTKGNPVPPSCPAAHLSSALFLTFSTVEPCLVLSIFCESTMSAWALSDVAVLD
ncbi:hypothetical protein K435DRAFT_857710 [Dendrothele bispora CBS 962.96]|uniref:Uncharacterized protein n=1 Tax=Dendrothele bispora (strain CBS 962.96) TaxID=1314807 RepID=A0A4S8M6B1_DENBC|nr:hypothetical protein K435DRAFT_857710 [Dendrothele bispora CBS 962.96]